MEKQSTPKVRITFVAGRGTGSYINLVPDIEFVAYHGTFREAAQRLAREGVYLERSTHCVVDRYIPGSAIIEIVPADQLKGL